MFYKTYSNMYSLISIVYCFPPLLYLFHSRQVLQFLRCNYQHTIKTFDRKMTMQIFLISNICSWHWNPKMLQNVFTTLDLHRIGLHWTCIVLACLLYLQPIKILSRTVSTYQMCIRQGIHEPEQPFIRTWSTVMCTKLLNFRFMVTFHIVKNVCLHVIILEMFW